MALSRSKAGDTAHGVIGGVVRGSQFSVESAGAKVFAIGDGGSALADKGADIPLIGPVVLVLRQHQYHLLCVLYPLHFLHRSHVFLEFFHGFIYFSVVEMVLDGTHHVSHPVQPANDKVYLVLAGSYHILYAPILVVVLLSFIPTLGLF